MNFNTLQYIQVLERNDMNNEENDGLLSLSISKYDWFGLCYALLDNDFENKVYFGNDVFDSKNIKTFHHAFLYHCGYRNKNLLIEQLQNIKKQKEQDKSKKQSSMDKPHEPKNINHNENDNDKQNRNSHQSSSEEMDNSIDNPDHPKNINQNQDKDKNIDTNDNDNDNNKQNENSHQSSSDNIKDSNDNNCKIDKDDNNEIDDHVQLLNKYLSDMKYTTFPKINRGKTTLLI